MNLVLPGRADLRMMPICRGTTTMGEQLDKSAPRAQLDNNFGACGPTLSPERLIVIGKSRREVRCPTG